MDYKVYLLNMLFGNTGQYTISVYRYTEKRYISKPDSIEYCKAYEYKKEMIALNEESLKLHLCQLDNRWKKDSSYAYIVITHPNNRTSFYRS